MFLKYLLEYNFLQEDSHYHSIQQDLLEIDANAFLKLSITQFVSLNDFITRPILFLFSQDLLQT